jgi:broad specificity phosphatase PhoE
MGSGTMKEALPVICRARHGETAWSLSGQYAGATDLPLTERGERNVRQLGELLIELTFARVFISPVQLGRPTCELAGFGAGVIRLWRRLAMSRRSDTVQKGTAQ